MINDVLKIRQDQLTLSQWMKIQKSKKVIRHSLWVVNIFNSSPCVRLGNVIDYCFAAKKFQRNERQQIFWKFRIYKEPNLWLMQLDLPKIISPHCSCKMQPLNSFRTFENAIYQSMFYSRHNTWYSRNYGNIISSDNDAFSDPFNLNRFTHQDYLSPVITDKPIPHSPWPPRTTIVLQEHL